MIRQARPIWISLAGLQPIVLAGRFVENAALSVADEIVFPADRVGRHALRRRGFEVAPRLFGQ